jgi:methionyl aminopeptidase
VCHGIPDTRPLELGDVVSFDVSCYVGGVHGDNCATIIIGDSDDETVDNNPIMSDDSSPSLDKDWRYIPYKTKFDSEEERERFATARRLVQAAIESRDEGVKACRPGGCLSDIGGAIHAVADAYGYDTVRHYRGHGISSDFHCAPFVKVRRYILFFIDVAL